MVERIKAMSEDGYNPIEWEESDFEIKLTEMKIDASGAIPITWCLSKKAVEWLQGSPKAWVMFVSTATSPSGRNAEWRGYAPISDMMAYITFLRPGTNKIIARITKDKDAVKLWMSRVDGRWSREVVDYPTHDVDSKEEVEKWNYTLVRSQWGWCDNKDYPSSAPFGSIQLDIPKDCFAPEPPEWEKTWVNFFWDNKAVDQCEYRKRRMLAYPWQVAPFLLVWCLRFLIAALPLTMGCYNANWKPVYFPINHSTFDIWDHHRGRNFFYIKSWGEPRWGLLIPLWIWAIAISLSFGNIIIPMILVSIVGAALGFALLIPILGWIFSRKVFGGVLIRLVDKLDKIIDKWWQGRVEKGISQQAEELQLMLCEGEAHLAPIKSIRDLPPRKRTIKLAFHGLKSQVCRPYSK